VTGITDVTARTGKPSIGSSNGPFRIRRQVIWAPAGGRTAS